MITALWLAILLAALTIRAQAVRIRRLEASLAASATRQAKLETWVASIHEWCNALANTVSLHARCINILAGAPGRIIGTLPPKDSEA